MGFLDRGLAPLQRVSLGSLDCTGTNETLRVKVPSAVSGPLLQHYFLTDRANVAEVWIPVGISYIITTGITVTDTKVTLWKNGVAVTGAGGVITAPIAALGPNEIFAPFGDYTLASAAAAGDAWSLKVTQTSTAGVINPVNLWYYGRQVPNINEGVSV